jgi:hypothetical protein
VQTGISTLPDATTSPMIHNGGETHRLRISVKAVYDGQKIVAVEAFIGPREAD